MNKFVIYTACIGGYDNIMQPEVVDERFDYVLFADDVKEERIGVWQVRNVEYTNSDKTRIARFVKTHPHSLLPQYNATLWLDANIQILSPKVYTRFIELCNSDIQFASVCHPDRDCIFDEAYAVSYLFNGFEHDYISANWCSYLMHEGYARHKGLYETNILFRKNNLAINTANELWWECICKYSKRDQLSCNYIVDKCNLKTAFFLPKLEHARNTSLVRYIYHNAVEKRKITSKPFFEKLRFKVVNLSDWHFTKGNKLWYRVCKSKYPVVMLNVIGLFGGTIFAPILFFNVLKHRLIKK